MTIINILGDLFSQTWAVFTSPLFLTIFHYFFITAPVWLPIVLAIIFWFSWINYIRSKFLASQKYVLLEIKLPPEVFKSPLAMETVLANLHITGGESTWYDKYIKGAMRPWYSLEIVSIEGNVHFFVWTRMGFKNLVESQFYGQYPNVELFEVSDYTDYAPYFDKKKISAWATHYKLTKPDPYPIKTYIDYGLDRDPKEEFKIDPLTTLIEYFSTLGKGEQVWMQVLFQSHKKKRTAGTFKSTDWQEEGADLIKKLQKEFRKSDEEDEDGKPQFRFPTKGETDILAALDRSISKLGFDVGIRLVYLAEKDKYIGARVPGFVTILKGFNSNILNGFAPTNNTAFDYPWQDFFDIRGDHLKTKYMRLYHKRAYFYPPDKIMEPFVLNTEELATIFHFPGSVLQTPSVNRVSSRKAEAPVNLPH
ncbi:MAG: hypothetical protein Q7S34_03140 [bacterium]|nr:hypothetical protein [bacterium]